MGNLDVGQGGSRASLSSFPWQELCRSLLLPFPDAVTKRIRQSLFGELRE